MNRGLICTVLSSLHKQRKTNRPIPECIYILRIFKHISVSVKSLMKVGQHTRENLQLVLSSYIMIPSKTLNFVIFYVN